MSTTQSLESALNTFLSVGDYSQKTRTSYTHWLQKYFNFLESRNLICDWSTVGGGVIAEYRELLKGGYLSRNTVYQYVKVLQRFYSWAYDKRLCHSNYASDLKVQRDRDIRKKRALTAEQIVRLLELPLVSEKDKRDRTLIVLMYSTGLRCSEVASIDLDDIRTANSSSNDPRPAKISVRRKGKVGKDREVKLGSTAWEELETFIYDNNHDRDPHGSVFFSYSPRNKGQRLTGETISRIVMNRLRQANILDPKITAHSLRHSFAVYCWNQNLNMYIIQYLLGHSSLPQTERYIQSITMEEERDKIVIDPLRGYLGKPLEF